MIAFDNARRVLVVVNSIAMASDMAIDDNNGISTYRDYMLWIVYGVGYGILPLLYALVALFLEYVLILLQSLLHPSNARASDHNDLVLHFLQ
jgi:hypothetical protein